MSPRVGWDPKISDSCCESALGGAAGNARTICGAMGSSLPAVGAPSHPDNSTTAPYRLRSSTSSPLPSPPSGPLILIPRPPAPPRLVNVGSDKRRFCPLLFLEPLECASMYEVPLRCQQYRYTGGQCPPPHPPQKIPRGFPNEDDGDGTGRPAC